MIYQCGKHIYWVLVNTFCRQRIVFHHVPRCGGNSVGKAMPNRYLLSRRTIKPLKAYHTVEAMWPNKRGSELFQKNYIFQQQLFIYMLMNDFRFIWAHIEFNESAYRLFKGKYKFITMLRDPVDRYISHYFSNAAYHPDSPFHISKQLSEFIGTQRGIQFGRIYCEYFSGLSQVIDSNINEAVFLAKKNLQKFAVIGFLGNPIGFAEKLNNIIGCGTKLTHKNKGQTPSAVKDNIVSPRMRERIRKTCEPDIEIYNYARGI